MNSTNGTTGNYDTGMDFWRDIAVSYGLEEAVIIGGHYLDTQIHSSNKEENQFCRELFAAMYEDTAGLTDPGKIVYPYSFSDAKSRLEISVYQDSRKRTESCARAIDSAIRDCCYELNYYNLEAAARKVAVEYGFERVNTVLAHNLQKRSYDGRFSGSNIQWAAGIELGDRCVSDAVLTAHPILIDGFARYTREMYAELDAERFALPGRPEQGELVQGYEILRSIQFEDGRGFALAHNPDAVSPFVSWQFIKKNGQRNFNWGKYCESETACENDFAARVASYLREEPVKEIDNYLRTTELSTEQNYNMIDGRINNVAAPRADLTDGQTHEEIRELAPETLPDAQAGEKPSLLDQLAAIKAELPEPTPQERSGHGGHER